MIRSAMPVPPRPFFICIAAPRVTPCVVTLIIVAVMSMPLSTSVAFAMALLAVAAPLLFLMPSLACMMTLCLLISLYTVPVAEVLGGPLVLTASALCLRPSLGLANSFWSQAVYMLRMVMCIMLPSVLRVYSPC